MHTDACTVKKKTNERMETSHNSHSLFPREPMRKIELTGSLKMYQKIV